MKKYIVISLVVISIVVMVFVVNYNKRPKITSEKTLEKVTLTYIEPAIHYAPIFVAMNNGYFKEEGLEVESVLLETGSLMVPQIISKNIDFALAGPEAPILSYIGDKTNKATIIAEVVQKSAIFLATRTDESDKFDINDLKGKTIIGAKAGTPAEVIFEYILRSNNIDKDKDLNLINNIPVSKGYLSFKAGVGDYALMGQPNMYNIEKDGLGKCAMKLSDYSPEYLSICLYTSEKLIKESPEKVQKFVNAICKAQDYINENSSDTIASLIKDKYEGINEKNLALIIEEYKKDNLFSKDNSISKEHYNELLEIIHPILSEEPKFEEVIDSSFVNKYRGNK